MSISAQTTANLQAATPTLITDAAAYGNTSNHRYMGLYFDSAGKGLIMFGSSTTFPATQTFARIPYTFAYSFDSQQDIQTQVNAILNAP